LELRANAFHIYDRLCRRWRLRLPRPLLAPSDPGRPGTRVGATAASSWPGMGSPQSQTPSRKAELAETRAARPRRCLPAYAGDQPDGCACQGAQQGRADHPVRGSVHRASARGQNRTRRNAKLGCASLGMSVMVAPPRASTETAVLASEFESPSKVLPFWNDHGVRRFYHARSERVI
jgi:hypothetical protein